MPDLIIMGIRTSEKSDPAACPWPPRASPEPLSFMADLGRELSAARSGREAVPLLLSVLERRLGAARSVLFTADARERALDIIAAHGFRREDLRARYGSGVAGRVAESGAPIVVARLSREPMALSELGDPSAWLRDRWSLICVPLSLRNARRGALSAYFLEGDETDLVSRVGLLGVAALLLSQVLEDGSVEVQSARPARARFTDESTGAASAPFAYADMVGESAAMRRIYEEVAQVAGTNATVLIRGESGTGKELVAEAIHANSLRAGAPFVKINCAALPETLFESELFGHERGAFTGAHALKRGRFELADGGTIFLDEVGELSLATQAKLLRVLQAREFERLGSGETLRTNVRLMAATNQDLEQRVASGSFRQDLYYRLNVFVMTLPPLRERRADIPALAEHFLAQFAAEHGRRITRISSGAQELLAQYSFPGNVRELQNVIERAVVVCDGVVVKEHHLPPHIREAVAPEPAHATLSQAVAALERRMLDEALRDAQGNAAQAARTLGTTERVVRYKAARHKLDPGQYRGKADE